MIGFLYLTNRKRHQWVKTEWGIGFDLGFVASSQNAYRFFVGMS